MLTQLGQSLCMPSLILVHKSTFDLCLQARVTPILQILSQEEQLPSILRVFILVLSMCTNGMNCCRLWRRALLILKKLSVTSTDRHTQNNVLYSER